MPKKKPVKRKITGVKKNVRVTTTTITPEPVTTTTTPEPVVKTEAEVYTFSTERECAVMLKNLLDRGFSLMPVAPTNDCRFLVAGYKK